MVLHTKGEVLHVPIPLARISDAIADTECLLWVDVVDPTREQLELLWEEFSFHPLALADVAKEG